MTTIGFIGLGNMGGPMAANLVKAGHTVLGFDLVPAALDKARATGVAIAGTAADAARDADVVITMLPSGRHLVAVYAEAVVGAARAGALLVDCSTVDVASCLEAHAAAAAKDLLSVDAPVSGGVSGAANASLTFMAGGSAAALARATPILQAMGKRVVPCGAAGSGQAAKTCNNMVLGISMIAVSEAFLLAEKLGLAPQALFDVMSTSSGQCWALLNHCPVPGLVPTSAANTGYRPGFAASLMLKDLKLARDAAGAVGAEIPLGSAAAGLYEQFETQDEDGLDYSAIIAFLRDRAGEGA